MLEIGEGETAAGCDDQIHDRPAQAQAAGLAGEAADDLGPPLDLAQRAFEKIGGPKPFAKPGAGLSGRGDSAPIEVRLRAGLRPRRLVLRRLAMILIPMTPDAKPRSAPGASLDLLSLLRCPRCRRPVHVGDEAVCESGHHFQVVEGVPLLVLDDDDASSKKQHDHQRDLYDRTWGGGRPYRLENWQKAYLRRLEKVWETCGPAAPFIDVGAGGDAYTVIEAARRGIPSVGSDLSLEGMRSARRFAEQQGVSDRCLFVVATVENLPFPEATFGAAAGIAIMEHVPDDRAAIAEVARVIQPSGRAYFTVPNSLAGAPFVLRRFYSRHDRRVGHLRHYSGAELEEKCSSAGLGRIQTLYTVHWEKVVQLGLHLVLGQAGIPHDRLWWWLESLDARHGLSPRGLHLHLVVAKDGQ